MGTSPSPSHLPGTQWHPRQLGVQIHDQCMFCPVQTCESLQPSWYHSAEEPQLSNHVTQYMHIFSGFACRLGITSVVIGARTQLRVEVTCHDQHVEPAQSATSSQSCFLRLLAPQEFCIHQSQFDRHSPSPRLDGARSSISMWKCCSRPPGRISCILIRCVVPHGISPSEINSIAALPRKSVSWKDAATYHPLFPCVASGSPVFFLRSGFCSIGSCRSACGNVKSDASVPSPPTLHVHTRNLPVLFSFIFTKRPCCMISCPIFLPTFTPVLSM